MTAEVAGAEPLVSLRSVSMSYGTGPARVSALRGVDLTIRPGEVVALLGPSGSGKSSVLQLLCEWDEPSAGAVEWGPQLRHRRTWRELAVVPQGLGLLDELSVRENVELPGRLSGGSSIVEVDGLLARLQLGHLAERRPSESSLGEQQRAAVARAVAWRPLLVVADEPTSNQDSASGVAVLEELLHCAADGAGTLIATHDAGVADRADRVLELRDGAVVSERRRSPRERNS